MTFVPGFNSRLYVGPLSYSQYTRGFTYSDTVAMLDATVLTNTSKVFIPGQDTGTFSIDALLDSTAAAGGQFAMLNTWKGTPQVVTLCPSGIAVNAETWMLQSNQSKAAVSAPLAGVVAAAMDVQCDGGTDVGTVISTETAISGTGNGNAVDGGAASTNGGVAHIHAIAFSGLTSDVVTIEHSVDGSTSWATLATFSTVTGTTSERVVVAPGTTVRRYLRVVDTVVGTGSVTRFVAFARR